MNSVESFERKIRTKKQPLTVPGIIMDLIFSDDDDDDDVDDDDDDDDVIDDEESDEAEDGDFIEYPPGNIFPTLFHYFF